MKRQTIIEAILFTLLVIVGSQTRVVLQDLPNFAPVAGLALFAGYFFRSRLAALALPLSIMVISDWQIDRGYGWWQTAVVYGMLAAPVFLRGFLRKHFAFADPSNTEFVRSLGGLMGCSLSSSVTFFIVTNAMCLTWYPPTWAGAVQCYVVAIPFFGYTLAGDMVFSLLTFGSFAIVMSCLPAANRTGQSATELPLGAPELKLATVVD